MYKDNRGSSPVLKSGLDLSSHIKEHFQVAYSNTLSGYLVTSKTSHTQI